MKWKNYLLFREIRVAPFPKQHGKRSSCWLFREWNEAYFPKRKVHKHNWR